MKKLQIKPELLTEEQRDKLEAYQAQQKQLTVLQDIADMTQDMVMESDKSKKFTQKAVEDMGALLVDMRESLDALKDKKAPEAPDYAKPVVEAVAKLEKALAAIEVKPSVTVSTPDVRVPAVDISPITKILKEEMPKAFEKAIGLMPKVEIPETDNSELLAAWEGISEQLVSIENATRMKPLPGSMTISNLDEVTSAIQTASKATDRYAYSAKSETATYKYYFFEDKDGNWYILRKTLATEVVRYAKGTGGIDSVFDSSTTDPSGSVTFASYATTFN